MRVEKIEAGIQRLPRINNREYAIEKVMLKDELNNYGPLVAHARIVLAS